KQRHEIDRYPASALLLVDPLVEPKGVSEVDRCPAVRARVSSWRVEAESQVGCVAGSVGTVRQNLLPQVVRRGFPATEQEPAERLEERIIGWATGPDEELIDCLPNCGR